MDDSDKAFEATLAGLHKSLEALKLVFRRPSQLLVLEALQQALLRTVAAFRSCR